MKQRLDQALLARGLVDTRSQAENWIRLGRVSVDDRIIKKPGYFVSEDAGLRLAAEEKYVSRAGLKLASVSEALKLDFKNKVVLDVGSSTGGFTDYALQHGARKVIAVDVGTGQMHPSLRKDERIELFEKTDIRGFQPPETPDLAVIDVSFISLRQILPHLAALGGAQTTIVAMVKPQFEAGRDQVRKGVIKNNNVRRQILKSFEDWARAYFIIQAKADSQVHGASGNQERFYRLRPLTK